MIVTLYPEKVSSDGRYLYFNVADTLGSDMYMESVLYQDPVIGNEYEYNSNYGSTEFAQLIYDFGLIGYLTNTRALEFGMHEATNKKYTWHSVVMYMKVQLLQYHVLYVKGRIL